MYKMHLIVFEMLARISGGISGVSGKILRVSTRAKSDQELRGATPQFPLFVL